MITGSLPADSILFESLDGSLIQQVARQCNGSAGPTGLDARAWRRMCTSFGRSSWNLCSAIAYVAHRICTKQVDPEGLHRVIITDLENSNKMADAYQPRKHTAFIDGRNNNKSFF